MHHPGPPRFVAVGEEVELAPRDPDPDATYRWHVAKQPDESAVALGDVAVEHLEPDVAGTYVVHLSGPDGGHDLTVRAFRSALTPASGGTSGASGPRSGFESGRSGVSGHSGVSGRSGSGGIEVPSGGSGRPRLRLDPVIEGDEAIVRADPIAHPDAPATGSDPTVEFLLDDRDAIDPDAVTSEGTELRVPLTAIGDRLRVHAVSVDDRSYSVPDAVEFVRNGDVTGQAVTTQDGVTASRLYDPPAWAEDAVIYEIYVRTFAGQRADEANGTGDEADERSAFDAIVDRLGYIESLGVDTLWLTPVLENDHAPHGYNITDFFSIADDLGTREDYERLIEAAHERGISVLFDLVCNHSARTHPHFKAAVADPDNAYHEWYEWRGPGEPETYFEWEHIANFDFTHLPVRRHLLNAIEEWAPIVDGLRIDMAWAVPNSFWREVHDRVKEMDNDLLLLDETIPYIPDFQGGCFDMHFDSTTYAALRRVGNGAPAEEILDAVDERAEIGFPPHAGFMLYAENHDETRYIVECGRPAAKAAMGALFTLPGAPMLYAGQEFGQRGMRDELAWEHTDEQLQTYVTRLGQTRRDAQTLGPQADLRRVTYSVTSGDPDRVVAFGRVDGSEATVTVLHFGEDQARLSLPAVTEARDIVSGTTIATDDGLRVDSVAVLPADPDALSI